MTYNVSLRFLLLARWVLAGIFIYAGLAKLATDPFEIARQLRNYALLPASAIHPLSLVLPWWEILAGVGLLLEKMRRSCALLLSIFCLVFAIAIGLALARGLDIECGCFGSGSAKAGVSHLLFNFLLLGLACWVYCASQRQRTELVDA